MSQTQTTQKFDKTSLKKNDSQETNKPSVGSVAYFEYLLHTLPEKLKQQQDQQDQQHQESSDECTGCASGCDAETSHIDEKTGYFYKTCELNTTNCLWCGMSCRGDDYCGTACAIAEKRHDDAANEYY